MAAAHGKSYCASSQPNFSKRTLVTITKTSATDKVISPPIEETADVEKKSISKDDDEVRGLPETMSIDITPSCIDRILYLARKKTIDAADMYLRIYVDAGGCSGFQYKFEILTKEQEPLDAQEDVEFPVGGTSVVVDTASLEFIQGSRVDYIQEMIRSSFVVIDNPMSESACGCGSSFALKNFEANPAIE